MSILKKAQILLKNAIDKYEGKDELQELSPSVNLPEPLDENILNNLNSKDKVIEYLEGGGKRIDSVDYIFWEDEEVFKKIINNVKNALEFAPRKILSDEKYFQWIVESHNYEPYMISCFNVKIKNNKELAFKAIDKDYYSVEYLGDEIREKEDILSYAKSKYGYIYYGDELDKETIMSYLSIAKDQPDYYKKSSYVTRNNVLIANYEIERDINNYLYFTDSLKAMSMFVKEVLKTKNNIHLIEHLPEKLYENKATLRLISLRDQEVAQKLIESINNSLVDKK